MLVIVGVLNIFNGIIAIANCKFFTEDTVYVLSDVRTWGWIVLILGIIQLFAAASVLKGGNFGRWIGMIVVGVNLIGQMMFLPFYPFWSILIIALDVMVIYALAVYYPRLRE